LPLPHNNPCHRLFSNRSLQPRRPRKSSLRSRSWRRRKKV
jgi:hypothetical protein